MPVSQAPDVSTASAATFRLAALSAVCVAMSACSTLNNATGRVAGLVSPYKVEVVQGNFVSKEQKDALQVGMPRVQVRDILGSPLVASAFHTDRWEYVFTIRRQGQELQQRKLTVFFKGDELARVEGDELISEQDFVASLSANRRLGKVPLLEVPPEVLREFGLKNAVPSGSAGIPAAGQQGVIGALSSVSYPPLEASGATTSAWDASTQRAVAASTAARANAAPQAPVLAPQAPLIASAPVAQVTAPAPSVPARPAAPAPTATTPTATAPVQPTTPAQAAAPSIAPAPVLAPTPVPSATAPALAAGTPAPPPPPPPPSVAPVRAPSPAAAAIASAPVSAPTSPPQAQPALPSPSASTLASADPDVTTFLNRWTSDWQSRNAPAYFSHYLPEFKGTSATRAEWEALRRTRIEGRSRISLAALDVRVRMVSPTEARLVFRQVYESDAFNEIGTKAMFLIKRDGRWFIEREFFTPLQ